MNKGRAERTFSPGLAGNSNGAVVVGGGGLATTEGGWSLKVGNPFGGLGLLLFSFLLFLKIKNQDD